MTLGGDVHIAAAANFKQTAGAINELFHEKTGHRAILSSASTGTLHSQITHGAPFDIFLSADRQSPVKLEAAGYGQSGQRFCYARGQLVLTGGSGSLDDLGNPGLSLAIANPATAPYGRAAEELLGRPEYVAASGRKLLRATNVLQAYQYWHSRSVDMALVAQSLAPGQGMAIPQDWYSPIVQEAILLTRARENPVAESYMTFLKSDIAQALIEKSGYGRCK
jgi:molybdate transport system substrate-binding protein